MIREEYCDSCGSFYVVEINLFCPKCLPKKKQKRMSSDEWEEIIKRAEQSLAQDDHRKHFDT